MIAITGLAEATERLTGLDVSQAGQGALEQAAQQLEAAVRETLSHVPGEDHAAPWLRTGALRASVGHRVSEEAAVIGSDDPVAVDQELGTRTIPPRPFLASTAAAKAEQLVEDFAAALARALGG